MKHLFTLLLLVSFSLGINAQPKNDIPQKKVLLEYFTTQGCGYCPGAQVKWKNVLSTRDNVIWVAHHVGFGTDIFTIDKSKEYLWFYSPEGATWAPAAMLDRTNLSSIGAPGYSGSSKGPIFSIGTETELAKLVDNQLALDPEVQFDFYRNYDEYNRDLSLAVTVKKLNGANLGSNLRLNVFLVEDGLIANQSGGSTTYVHDHIIKEMLTPAWGEEVVFDSENEIIKDFDFSLPEADAKGWHSENMYIVAFLSNYNSKNQSDCKVYNAEVISLEGFMEGTDVEGISLPESEISLAHNATYQLKAKVLPYNAGNKKVTWTSSNPDAATINDKGLVSGVAEGTTTITATTEEGNFTASCTINVFNYVPVQSVVLEPKNITLEIGKSFQLEATVSPEDASYKDVTWSCTGAPSFITLDQTGLITGVKKGVVTVVVTSVDSNRRSTCKVTIVEATDIDEPTDNKLIENIAVNDNFISLKLNETSGLTISLIDISGKQVYSNYILDSEATIPTYGFKGVYLLKINTSKGSEVRKVIL